MRILYCIIALLGLSLAAMDSTELSDLLRDAERCFEGGNEAHSREDAVELWRKAAVRYERAVKEGGVSNGALYYNLGNVYFRLGDTGRAILNYRRAQRLIPNDRNLMKNLAFARSRCQDSIEETESRKVLKTLLFWHYDFALGTRELVFIFAFCLACILASIRLKMRRGWLTTGAVLLFLCALVMAASMVTTELSERSHRSGVIIADETTGYNGNSTSYEKTFQAPLHAGTEFALVEKRGSWIEIVLANGMTTWIEEQDAELL